MLLVEPCSSRYDLCRVKSLYRRLTEGRARGNVGANRNESTTTRTECSASRMMSRQREVDQL